MNTPITVSFNNQTITAFMHNDAPVVAMKAICENLGLDWRAQRQRILRHPVLSKGVVVITTPSEGGEQITTCLPLSKLNGWLFGIDSSRVKPELKDKVISYQEKCFDVLSDYFGFGKQQAITPSPEKATKQVLIGGMPKEQQDAIKALVNSRIDSVPKEKQRGTAMKLWGAINRKFGTTTYKEIPPEEFTNVLSLVSRLSLEGEFIAATDKPKQIENQQATLYPMMDYTIPKTDNWHDRFEAGQHGVNNLAAGILTGDAKVIDKTLHEIVRSNLDMMRVNFCSCGASVGYVTMIARYAIIGMQACSTPLLVSRI